MFSFFQKYLAPFTTVYQYWYLLLFSVSSATQLQSSDAEGCLEMWSHAVLPNHVQERNRSSIYADHTVNLFVCLFTSGLLHVLKPQIHATVSNNLSHHLINTQSYPYHISPDVSTCRVVFNGLAQ